MQEISSEQPSKKQSLQRQKATTVQTNRVIYLQSNNVVRQKTENGNTAAPKINNSTLFHFTLLTMDEYIRTVTSNSDCIGTLSLYFQIRFTVCPDNKQFFIDVIGGQYRIAHGSCQQSF